jgi:hypothetical protein
MKYTSMKTFTILGGIFAVLLLGLLTGCGHKSAPLKEGVIWKVVWSESTGTQTGLYRDKTMPKYVSGIVTAGGSGEYGVDMYGKLYPTFLEVRRVGSKDSHSQIIPWREIVELEFGDGGVSFSQP